MPEQLKILMLEDNSTDAEIVQRLLTRQNPSLTFKLVMDQDAYLLALDSFLPDIILADNSLPQFNATEALSLTRARLPHIPFILVTGTVSEEFAAGIIKKGADDYVLKDRLARLPAAIEAAVKHRTSEKQSAAASRRLLESEEKYRTLIDYAFDGIIIYSQSGKIIDCNRSACSYLGYELESIKRLSITDLFPPHELALRPLYFDTLKAGESTIDYRKLKKKTGDYIEMEISTKMMPDGNLMAIGRDISERRKAADQKALFASIVNFSDDAIISQGLDGIISSWNRGAVSLFGYTAEEAIGRHISIIIPANHMADELVLIEKIKQGKSVVHYETERLKKDGSMVNISLTASPLRNSKGLITGASKIARNISEQKKAEQKIIQSEENLKAIFDNSSEGFILTDTSGIIKILNNWTKERMLFGTEKEIAAGNSIFDFIEEKHKDLFQSQFLAVLAGRAVQFDRPYTEKSGNVNWINFTLNPVKKNGSITSVCITARDITEKKISDQEKEFDRNNLNALINNTHDLMWSVDLNFNLITSNQAFDDMVEDLSGSKVEKGNNIFSWQFESSIQQLYKERYERAFAGEVFGDLDHMTGSEDYWFELSFFPIYEHKKVVGTACFARDISEQRKAAEEIRKSNDRFEIVASATNDVIWDWNLDTNSLWWNKNYYSHFGYPVGKTPDINSWYNNIHKEDSERVLAGIHHVIDTGRHSWTDEYRFLKADGTPAFVLDCGYIIYSTDGRPIRMVGAMLDITERKKAEQQITKSLNEKQALAERFSCILNTLPANIALLDSNGVIIEVNNAWQNFGGENCFQGKSYPVGENYIAMSAATRTKREKDAALMSQGILSILQGKTEEFVFEYCCPSRRSELWFRMVATPLKDQEYAGAVVMHIDISQLKKLEQERLTGRLNEQKKITRAVMQTEEKERDKLGRELHDNLCQLLAAVKMKLSSCREDDENNFRIITESVKCLEDAINETRHLSHRMLTPRFAENNLADALDHLASLYNHGSRIVELDADFDESENIPAPVKETVYRIAQEQFNNIEKYAKATQVKVHLHASHCLLRLMIEDNGAGFDTSKKRYGAGLTNIMNRAESFNGSAKIFSSPGEGCVLLVEIPLSSVRLAV